VYSIQDMELEYCVQSRFDSPRWQNLLNLFYKSFKLLSILY